MSIQRPNWLPTHLPELDGLRGLAILAVVLYHCYPRLEGTWIHSAAEWGWAGVNLFFVLSGFLITSILLGTRDKTHYFQNFHARRALRIWPVYLLVLAVVYGQSDWFIGPRPWEAVKAAPWLAYIFFVQNLFPLRLPPAIGPTWALAIEEQYYFLWAPLVRWLRRPWMLAMVLIAALVCSPLLRHLNPVWMWDRPTHTLIKLDGIAWGSLLALGLHTLLLSRRTWLWIGLGGLVLGIAAAATIAGGTAFLDSALAIAFTGAVLASIASTGVPGDRSSSLGWKTGARNPLNTILRRGPLPFYGRISYGLYMTHIMVFIYFGWFDLRMDRYGAAGNLAVVGFRLVATTAVATALWYGFESQILKLKRYF
ncbi:MAG: acyltransferase family protein [Terracidiphilus sp.]